MLAKKLNVYPESGVLALGLVSNHVLDWDDTRSFEKDGYVKSLTQMLVAVISDTKLMEESGGILYTVEAELLLVENEDEYLIALTSIPDDWFRLEPAMLQAQGATAVGIAQGLDEQISLEDSLPFDQPMESVKLEVFLDQQYEARNIVVLAT